jgi:hypothetical protein
MIEQNGKESTVNRRMEEERGSDEGSVCALKRAEFFP